MTDEEAFNILQVAEDMSHKNWMQFRLLYNNKFKEAEYRIKELEAALRLLIEWHDDTGVVMLDVLIDVARTALTEEKNNDPV